MITLYLVRHGETTYNAEGRVQGHEDPPLTPLGFRQAKAIADRLASEKIDAVYSSDLVRATSTAEIIAARHSLSIETTALLRESNLGVLQGMTREEVEERYPKEVCEWRRDPVKYRPPGGETTDQVIGRARQFLDSLTTRGSLTAVIVGHGGSLRGMVISALSLPIDTYHKLHFSNAGLSVVQLAERRELRLFNDTCHLDSLRGTLEETDSAV